MSARDEVLRGRCRDRKEGDLYVGFFDINTHALLQEPLHIGHHRVLKKKKKDGNEQIEHSFVQYFEGDAVLPPLHVPGDVMSMVVYAVPKNTGSCRVSCRGLRRRIEIFKAIEGIDGKNGRSGLGIPLQYQEVVMPAFQFPSEKVACPTCHHKRPAVDSCACKGSPAQPLDLTTTDIWGALLADHPRFIRLDDDLQLQYSARCITMEDGVIDVQVDFKKTLPRRFVDWDRFTGQCHVYRVVAVAVQWRPFNGKVIRKL